MLFSELKRKEVISVKSCNKIGFVTDMEFDPCSGCIKKIYVSQRCRCFPNLLNEQECSIALQDICQFGTDIITVNV